MGKLGFTVIHSGLIEISMEKGVMDARPSCSLLRLGSMNILIDLEHPKEDGSALREELEREGLTPADIQYVFFTHLHPDHIGHKNLFTEATFVFHKDEKMSFLFRDDRKIELSGSSIFGITESTVTGPMKAVSVPDMGKLGNSMYIHHCPGHTPGSVAIFVNIENKVHAFTGDLFLTKEYFDEMKVPGSTWDALNIPAQMEFIREVADVIIPGHGEPFEVKK